MAFVMTERATSLLIFLITIHGTLSLLIKHLESFNATAGENISLPCIVSTTDQTIIQLQWHKVVQQIETKLVVYNPIKDIHYMENVKLEPVKKANSNELQGSILVLYGVTEEDSGEYVCEITFFPSGSFKFSTKVQIKAPQVLVKVTSPIGNLIEGDKVSITCVSDPQANSYKLWSSQSDMILESLDGEFIIQNITRKSSNLICQPIWTSASQHLQSLQAAVNLTVDFIDFIKCNTESWIDSETGKNLTITCEAKSSKPLQFVWMKGNESVSNSTTMNLWEVTPDQSGTYTLIVHTGNQSRLQRQKDVMVNVYNRTPTEKQWSNTMAMETSQISSSTRSNPITSTIPTTENVYSRSTASSTGDITTVHANGSTTDIGVKGSSTNSTHTSRDGTTLPEGCCKSHKSTSISASTKREFPYLHTNTSTVFTSTSISKSQLTTGAVLTTEVKVTVKEQSKRMTHVVYFIIPLLLLLVLIGCLYRRYLREKRMDMPPPFKPPPPPVKYTSKRHHEILITDILE